MTVARSELVPEGVEGIYHCISRCVRRAFLCGADPYTGKSFEHRKEWVLERLKKLTETFALEVCAFAVMSNHLHVVVRTLPHVADAWSPLEIAARWLQIFPRNKADRASLGDGAIAALAGDAGTIELLRVRLGSVSWFMRCLNEHIARRANREDDCKGRFWEGRFKCQAILDDSALLACLAYVDLNPIRAGVAQSPEESLFTSANLRISSRQAVERLTASPAITVGPHASTSSPLLSLEDKKAHSAGWLAQFESSSADKAPLTGGRLLPMKLDDYLRLLDWTGRALREGKTGAIPDHFLPIMDRLQIQNEQWLTAVESYGHSFFRAAGRTRLMTVVAGRVGLRWFKGVRASRKFFQE
ncbi:MAG: transposase [Pseudomonadota bacterium]